MTTFSPSNPNIEVEIRLINNVGSNANNLNKEELIQEIKMNVPNTFNNSQAFLPAKGSKIGEKVDRIFINSPTEPEGVVCLLLFLFK